MWTKDKKLKSLYYHEGQLIQRRGCEVEGAGAFRGHLDRKLLDIPMLHLAEQGGHLSNLGLEAKDLREVGVVGSRSFDDDVDPNELCGTANDTPYESVIQVAEHLGERLTLDRLPLHLEPGVATLLVKGFDVDGQVGKTLIFLQRLGECRGHGD